ncbi:rubrerythrin family protein [Actinoallomurus iriomotensis]|nr:rubrerythrin family protein [Actinoallomurus iriomotensis]
MRLPVRALLGSAATIALSAPVYGGVATAAIAAPTGTTAPASARPPGPQTRADLATAMRGEAFANVSYRLYAEQARREGLSSVADLFDNAANIELNEHFTKAAALSDLVGDDAANLRSAISGEAYEATTMYPRFAQQARSDGDGNAADRFSEIAGDEARHREAFRTALGVVQTGRGTVPAAPQVHPVQVTAGTPKVRSEQTKTNLDTAMHGEATAYAKYTLWGKHAAKEGDADVGRLFTGTAGVERQEHFAEHADLAGLVGTTHQNLTKAIAGERYESTTMYPRFAERARAAGDTEAARFFTHNADDEAGHANDFQKAKDAMS